MIFNLSRNKQTPIFAPDFIEFHGDLDSSKISTALVPPNPTKSSNNIWRRFAAYLTIYDLASSFFPLKSSRFLAYFDGSQGEWQRKNAAIAAAEEVVVSVVTLIDLQLVIKGKFLSEDWALRSLRRSGWRRRESGLLSA